MRLLLPILLVAQLICAGQTPELTVQLGHSKLIYDVSYSPDGKYAASASADRTVKIWELSEGREVQTIYIDEGYATTVQFAANSKELLVGGGSYSVGELKIYDLETGKVSVNFIGHQEYAWNAEFSIDQQRVYSSSFDQTIKCWDRHTGEELHSTDEMPGLMRQLSVDPLGEYIAATCDEFDVGASIWTANDLSFVRLLHVDELFEARTIKFSGDGAYIIVGDYSTRVAVFRRNEEAPLYVIDAHEAGDNLVRCLGADQSGQYFFTGSSDRTIHQYNIRNGELEGIFTGHADEVYALDVHPKGNQLLSGGSFDKSIKEWDIASNKLIRSFGSSAYPIRDLALSNDGKYLFVNSYDRFGGDVYSWRLDRMNQMDNVGDASASYSSMNLREDELLVSGTSGDLLVYNYPERTIMLDYQIGQSLYLPNFHHSRENFLVGLHDDPNDRSSTISYYEIDPLKNELYNFSADRDRLPGNQSMGYSVDEQSYYILEGNWGNNQINKYNTETDELQFSIIDTNHLFPGVAVQPNDEHIILYSNSKATMINSQSGQVDWVMDSLLTSAIQDIHFIDNDRVILSGGEWSIGYVMVVDVNTKKVLLHRKDFTTGQGAVTYDAARNFIISGGDDARITLMDAEDLSTELTLFAFGDAQGEWAAIHPSGLFDGSKEAIERYLYFTYKLEPIKLFQLKERYYEPGLVQKVLGYNSEPLRDISRLRKVHLYPSAQLEIQDDLLRIYLIERSGGLGKVSFLINGKEMLEDLSASFNAVSDEPNSRLTASINLSNYTKFLQAGGSNKLEIITSNEDESITSPPYFIEYVAPTLSGFGQQIERPAMHALVIGTSDYRGEQLDLSFAAKDAQDIAKAIRIGGEQLFGANHVNIHLLHTDSEEEALRPSKLNIAAKMKEIAAVARPEDVILLYFSGHGVTFGSPVSQFYYLTKDVASGDLSDADIREAYAISTNDITNWINAIPAQKQIMILDACASGQAVEDLLGVSKNVNSSQIKALDKMKDRTGLFIVAGSAANKVSFEASQYGQSLLTYSLLSGLNIISAKSEDKMVDLVDWINYSKEKVPELAGTIGGVQEPVVALPRNLNSFDIAHIPDPSAIPLASVKPVFVRSTLMDLDEQDDVLALSEKLDSYFQNLSARGKSSAVIFIDIKKFPEAYSIKGFYEIIGDAVEMSITLRRGDAKIGKITTSGYKTDPDGLIDQVIGEVMKLIETRD